MGIVLAFKTVTKTEKDTDNIKSYDFAVIMEENRKKQQKLAEERAANNQTVKKSHKLTK